MEKGENLPVPGYLQWIKGANFYPPLRSFVYEYWVSPTGIEFRLKVYWVSFSGIGFRLRVSSFVYGFRDSSKGIPSFVYGY